MSGRPPLDKDLHFVDVHVGARLRWRREQRGVSQKRLAKTLRRLFPAHPQIRERPQRISPSRLYRFARHLDVRVAWFFEGLPAGRDAPARAKTVLAQHDLFSRETAQLVEAYYRIADPR